VISQLSRLEHSEWVLGPFENMTNLGPDPLLGTMMRTSEIDMADSVERADIDTFIDNAAWAICSTYHTVLKASPGAAIFGLDMLFDIPFVADWKQIGE